MYQAHCQVLKFNSHLKQTGFVSSWRKHCQGKKRYAHYHLCKVTQDYTLRPPTTPDLMLQVAALNNCSPGLTLKAENSGATIASQKLFQKWSSVLHTQCQFKYAYNFSPLFSNHLRLNKRLFRIPHPDTLNVLHNKSCCYEDIFSTVPAMELSPLLKHIPFETTVSHFDSGFPQLRWSKNVSSEYRNNPCSAKQASESENSLSVSRPSVSDSLRLQRL